MNLELGSMDKASIDSVYMLGTKVLMLLPEPKICKRKHTSDIQNSLSSF